MESYKAQNAVISKSTYPAENKPSSYQQREQPPSEYYKRGLDPANHGYDYERNRNMDIEITDVDASEKKRDFREQRPSDQYSREYIPSFTNELPRDRDQPNTYHPSEKTAWEHSYDQTLKEREKN